MKDRFSNSTISDSCEIILAESSNPLHVNELYSCIVEGGFEFKGRFPMVSIVVALNRNPKIKKVSPGTYDLLLK